MPLCFTKGFSSDDIDFFERLKTSKLHFRVSQKRSTFTMANAYTLEILSYYSQQEVFAPLMQQNNTTVCCHKMIQLDRSLFHKNVSFIF